MNRLRREHARSNLSRLGVLVLALVLGGVWAADARTASDCPAFHFEPLVAHAIPSIESITLSNGLRVFLVPRPHDRSVSVRIAYDVGARDEPSGRGGVAHLFEHMMFKGSLQLPDGAHFRWIRDVGGVVNATTDYDTTQYWNTVPASALSRVLVAEADRMKGLRLSEASLENQRDAIREEGLGLEGLPYVTAASEFGLALWKGTPYGHSPLGTPEELASTTLAEAETFFSTYYTPNHAVLVVAGGFDPEIARVEIERRFGAIAKGPDRPPRAAVKIDRVAVTREFERVVAVDPLAPFPIYAAIWLTEGVRDRDANAVRVLDDVLIGGPDARFVEEVERSLALDAYALPIAFRDVGLLNYVFAPRTFVSISEIDQALHDAIHRLRTRGISDTELCGSVRREMLETLSRLETNEGVAAAVASGALLRDDPTAVITDLGRLSALDRAALDRVIDRYLREEWAVLEIRPAGVMRWVKPVLEWLPDGVGTTLEESLIQ